MKGSEPAKKYRPFLKHQNKQITELNNENLQTQSKKPKHIRFLKTQANSDDNFSKHESKSPIHMHSSNKQNLAQNLFDLPEYKQFISVLTYEIMVKSKQKISMKLQEKSKSKHFSNKVFNYLKKNQKSASSKHKSKVMELKMKNIASKEINQKDLDHIYADFNRKGFRQQFYQSPKNNWFRDETEREEDFSGQQRLKTQKSEQKSVTINGEKKKPNLYKSNTHIIALNKKFNDAKKKFTLNTVQTPQQDQRKVTFAVKTESSDDSSQDEYLCKDDTGLINNLVQNSRGYKKQLSFLFNSSQRQSACFSNKKTKQKSCMTEGNNAILSHNLINDILKRLNPTKKGKTMVSSHQTSKKQSNTQSQCQSAKKVEDGENDKSENVENEHNQSNLFSEIFSLLQPKKVQISKEDDAAEMKNNENTFPQDSNHLNLLKYQKTNSFTNYTSNHSSSKFLKSNQPPLSPFDRKTSIPQSKNPGHMQSLFFSQRQKYKRPKTAMNEDRKCQCNSFMYNMWIQTEPSVDERNVTRNSELQVGSYNFREKNISLGDHRIWKRLNSGKIVKKSIKSIRNQDHQSFRSKNDKLAK